jgi:hypothetical protein
VIDVLLQPLPPRISREQELLHQRPHLGNRLLGLIGQCQDLVCKARRAALLRRTQERYRRIRADARRDRAENRTRIKHNLVGGQGDQQRPSIAQ